MATYQNPYVETFFITFNLDDERFDDLAVRQALSYAVDRQQIVDKDKNPECESVQDFYLLPLHYSLFLNAHSGFLVSKR